MAGYKKRKRALIVRRRASCVMYDYLNDLDIPYQSKSIDLYINKGEIKEITGVVFIYEASRPLHDHLKKLVTEENIISDIKI